MRCFYLIGALAAGLAVASAPAQTRFDPRELKGPRNGPPNELLVLGTPHLSQLPAPFQPAALAPLIERLRGWKPQQSPSRRYREPNATSSAAIPIATSAR
jgi:hypothetical protein